jgi:Ca2+-binding EF-hand superfamily protein
MRYRSIALFAATLLATGAIAADNDSRSMQNSDTMFKSLDKNSDGKISQSEAANASDKNVSAHFAALDKNSDGYLDRREFQAHERQHSQQSSSNSSSSTEKRSDPGY